ncbi:MAG: hypothetical protein ACON4S_06420 [Porticoccaceae bacterium]
MKKMGFIFLLILPMFSYAESVRLFSVFAIHQDDRAGTRIGYTRIDNGRYITTLRYSNFSEDDSHISAYDLGLNYVFQSVYTGSFYAGIGIAHSRVFIRENIGASHNSRKFVKASNQNDFSRLGYSKLSGVGIDYDYSLFTVDGKTTVGALWRGAINNSNYGWLLDVTSNSDVDTVSAGISVIF